MVFFQDECHLLWEDLCSYVWGKTSQRIEVSIHNQREKQACYGAVNLYDQQCLIQAFEKGNSDSTLASLTYFLKQYPNRQIALIWDGASCRSLAVTDYLQSVNQGLDESAWRLTCIQFAPKNPT